MKPGEIIRTPRIELDLSLREVARASGFTPVQLGEMERDVVPYTAANMPALMAAMARLVEPRAKQRASTFRTKMEAAVRR